MYHSLSEVIDKSRRKNDLANRRLHPLASRISVYFSWLFINIGLSANWVTFLFFLFGLSSTILILGNSVWYVICSYLAYRIHIIIDVSDGEVARYNQTFSINGSYWDSMIHQVIYPILFINMCIAQYLFWGDTMFLFFGMFGGLVTGLTMAVKNNYYKAMLFNNKPILKPNNSSKKASIKQYAYIYTTDLLNFEGLYIFYFLAFIWNDKVIYLLLFGFFIFVFLLQVLAKFALLSIKGQYPGKS